MLDMKDCKKRKDNAEEPLILSVGFFEDDSRSSGGRYFMKHQLDDEMILLFSIYPKMGFNKRKGIKGYVERTRRFPTSGKTE